MSDVTERETLEAVLVSHRPDGHRESYCQCGAYLDDDWGSTFASHFADAILAALPTRPAAGEVEWEYAVRDRRGRILFTATAGEVAGNVAVRRRKAGPWIEVQS